MIKFVVMALLIGCGLNATAQPSYKALTVQDMAGFHWSIAGKFQDDFSANTGTFGRDLNWVINNKEKISALRGRGKKVICYFNWGRLQSKKPSEAYDGVYSAYKGLDRKSMCNEAGDKWGEPWINLKGPKNQHAALSAWKKIIDSAKSHCDGLEYDNSDVFENIKSGGNRPCGTAGDAIKMLRETCKMTHEAGMNCILKNTFSEAHRLSDLFDGAIGEQCFAYSENAGEFAKAFKGKKPVACVEYKNVDVESGKGAYRRNFASDCSSARSFGFSNLAVERRQSIQGDPVQSCAGTNTTVTNVSTPLSEAETAR